MTAAATSPPWGRLAPAKVNLFLHIGPVEADGYHPVASLMAFADVGDALALEPTAAPGVELVVDGPFAPELADTPPERNLVVRAAARLLENAGRPELGVRLRLTKALPVAAGLGGGSSDAGAALRLVRDALLPEVGDEVLAALAGELGADGPACLRAEPVLGLGRGDALHPAPVLPELHAVLVNPRTACPTGAVYRAYDAGPPAAADLPPLPAGWADADALAAFLKDTRNDLEAPAAGRVPAVAEVLAAVRAAPDCRFARLSGSGATVWALARDADGAQALAQAVAGARPDWWTAPCRLGGPWDPAPRSKPLRF